MAAAIEMRNTPKKNHSLTDRCCFCGMSFLEIFITGSGTKNIQKRYKQKLKLTGERILTVKRATSITLTDLDTGICQKCYRKVESILKHRQTLDQMIGELEKQRSKIEQVINLLTRADQSFKS